MRKWHQNHHHPLLDLVLRIVLRIHVAAVSVLPGYSWYYSCRRRRRLDPFCCCCCCLQCKTKSPSIPIINYLVVLAAVVFLFLEWEGMWEEAPTRFAFASKTYVTGHWKSTASRHLPNTRERRVRTADTEVQTSSGYFATAGDDGMVPVVGAGVGAVAQLSTETIPPDTFVTDRDRASDCPYQTLILAAAAVVVVSLLLVMMVVAVVVST